MSGHEFQSFFPESGEVDMSDTSTNIDETTMDELRQLAARYPQPRSALLPMLHLVQSVDGRVSPAGVEACAQVLGITEAQVSGVATFYKDENRDAQYNELAESKLDENENVVYFVNGEAADEDAFTAVINAQNEKADVTFVPATAENLALYLTIE